jgi:hypothetical protein
MKLTELFLNRFLYRDNSQNLETKDSAFVSADSTPATPSSVPSGGAAQDINTGNVTINGGQLTPGTYPQTVLDVSNWGWGQTCAFTSTDLNTVSWGSGTFKSADGTSYSISAENTGNMTAKTYIYLSLLTSSTAYQITTTPATAVGVGKVLIAVANPDTTTATYNLSEATQIVGDNILANTINASKITTGQLVVGTNVGIGTAQDATQVTTIVGNTVTTGYVSALNITAVGTVTSGTFNGCTFNAKSGSTTVASLDSGGLKVYGQYATFKDTSGNDTGQVFANGSEFLMNSFNGKTLYLLSPGTLTVNGAGVELQYSGGTQIKLTNTQLEISKNTTFGGNTITGVSSITTSTATFNNGSSNSVVISQSGTSTPLQVGSYSFRPVGYTFKDGSGTNKQLIVLATQDPF